MDGGDDQAAKPMRLIVKLPKLSRAQDQGPESMDVEPAAGTAAVAREGADQAGGAQGEASPAAEGGAVAGAQAGGQGGAVEPIQPTGQPAEDEGLPAGANGGSLAKPEAAAEPVHATDLAPDKAEEGAPSAVPDAPGQIEGQARAQEAQAPAAGEGAPPAGAAPPVGDGGSPGQEVVGVPEGDAQAKAQDGGTAQPAAEDKMDVDVKEEGETGAAVPQQGGEAGQVVLKVEQQQAAEAPPAAPLPSQQLQAQAAASGAAANPAVAPSQTDASFYQVLRMQAAQAQAEAQAQAVQAAQQQQAQGVGSPMSQGKVQPANVQVQYMGMPPPLQGMPGQLPTMQVPKGFLVPQQMMVQAAQAQVQAAQAQAQALAQAQAQQKPKALDKDAKAQKVKKVAEPRRKVPGKGPAKGSKGPKEKLTQKDAIEYLTKVKERFKDKPSVYNKFLDIMKKFRMNKIDTHGVVELVKTLFKGHKDLLLGFNTFVPNGYEIKVDQPKTKKEKTAELRKKNQKKKQPIEFNQAINYVNKIKKRFADDERVYKAFLEILNMYRKGKKGIYRVYEEVSVLFEDHPDLLKEFTFFLPDSQPPPQLTAPGNKRLPAAKKASASKRSKTSAKSSKDEEDKKVKLSLASLGKELQFFERVKSRLRSKEAYQDFLKCLNIFSQEIISKMELQGLVYDIIGKYSDLVQGFNDFLSRCESMDLDLSVKNILGKDGKALEAARTSVSSKEMQQKLKAISMREKYNTRPISDLDFTGCEQCTPSYRKLPADYPKMSFKGRDKHKSPQLKTMFAGMLNDQWVSLPTGSEDAFGRNLLRRNQYEEALFRCEDDRFELEMCIECNSATIKVLDKFAEQIPTLSDEAKRSLTLPDDLLGPVHIRSIEKIYAEHGQTILDLLRRIPGYSVPIVHKRLKEKDAEWRHVQSEMNNVWRKVYEQNYHKSLDHRSFYFKQIDKKNLSSKGIISEIKEKSEERKKNQDMKTKLSKAIATFPDSEWTDQHTDVDIVFDCNDKALHDEIYGIIAYAADEMLSADLSAKVTRFWREFYEPFFGLTLRDPEDRKKHVAETNEGVGDTAMEEKNSEDNSKEAEQKTEGMDVDSSENNEEEEEGVEEEESDPTLEFAKCKPIAAHLVPNGKKNKKGKTVFYGNDAFYVLFRLHNFLYERLAIVEECAQSGENKWNPNQKESKPTKASKEEQAASAKKVQAEYMQLLYRLIDGTTENSQYEDECRHLLGAKAYILFTVDKLIYKLVKQVQSIVTDDLLLKLQALYNYERERNDNLFNDSVYYANSLVLLNDETRFRIGVMEEGKVSAQILDVAVNKCDIPAVAMDKSFSDYLKKYVEYGSSVSAYEPGKIFLTRTLQGIKGKGVADEHLREELKKFHVSNGLECKIACNTSKSSYVLDTEDVLLRKGGIRKSSADGQVKKRKERFEKWIEAEIEKASESGGD